MFGYIKPCVPLLTVAEYEAYKGVYCGLCREMGTATGQFSRMTLSYDFSFLAFYRMLMDKTPTTFSKGACMAHPFKKKTFAESNPALTYCAYASAILSAEKIKDDIADEKGFKRFGAKALSPFGKAMVSRAPKEFSALAEKVDVHLKQLAEIERNKTASIDAPADIFGAILGDIFAFGQSGSSERISKEIGRSIGKIIYVLDAADDVEKDLKCEKYNPIALIYSDPLEESAEGKRLLKAEIRDALTTAVMLELGRAKVAFSLIDTAGAEIYSRIILNVLDFGIPEETKRVLTERKKRENPLKRSF